MKSVCAFMRCEYESVNQSTVFLAWEQKKNISV